MCDLKTTPIPKWLANLTPESIVDDAFPLHGILESALYYPCSGFDGRPVQFLGHHTQSFIYADYGVTLECLEQQLNSEECRFSGYEILGRRSVSQHELVPDGWRPVVNPNFDERPPKVASMQNPFCEWIVFERLVELDEQHGPERFSLVYLAADGAAAYQALFCNLSPRAVAIIQPGHGFGGNYSDFCDPEALFARSVRASGSAMPDILLNGGIGYRSNYEAPIWHEYKVDLGWLPGQNIRVWGRSA